MNLATLKESGGSDGPTVREGNIRRYLVAPVKLHRCSFLLIVLFWLAAKLEMLRTWLH